MTAAAGRTARYALLVRTFASACLACVPACRPPATPTIAVVVSSNAVTAAEVAREVINRGVAPGDSVAIFIAPPVPPISAEPAITLATQLARRPGMRAVVGHANSSASLAASQIYNAERIVQIAPTTTSPVYSRAGPYSFSMVPDDRAQGRFIAETVLADTSVRRVAISYTNDDYGRELLREVKQRLASSPIQIVIESPHLSDAPVGRMRNFAEKLAALRPDLLVWLSRPPPLYALRTDFGVKIPVLGGDGLEGTATYANPRGAFTGVRFVRFLDPDNIRSAEFRAFQRAYRARTEQPLTAEAVYTYDAILLIAQAIRSGADEPEALRDFVAATGRSRPPYPGVGGPVRFDSAGAAVRTYLLTRIPPR